MRDALRGSTKFHDSKHDLGVIRECIEDLDIQSEGFKLKNTKPIIKFYGSYNEMLQMLLLRQGGLGGGEKSGQTQMQEAFKTNPAEFSYEETGQQVLEEDFDEKMIDMTPNSMGQTNTVLNQTQSGGFTQHIAQFNSIKSKEI